MLIQNCIHIVLTDSLLTCCTNVINIMYNMSGRCIPVSNIMGNTWMSISTSSKDMAGGDQFWYMENRADYGSVIMGDLQDNMDISGDCINDLTNDAEEDVFEYSVKTAEYEDTTKLYDIINHYMDDEILIVEISHPDQHPVVTITNDGHDLCVGKDRDHEYPKNEDTAKDGCCVDVEDESPEETPGILLTGHPGDILGQIFDDQLGVLYNIYR